MMDKLKEVLVGEFLDTDSRLNAVVAFEIKAQLKQEGYTVNDKSGEKTPSFKELMNHLDKKEKGEKKKTQDKSKTAMIVVLVACLFIIIVFVLLALVKLISWQTTLIVSISFFVMGKCEQSVQF
jgi:Flp pilus assembly protein TadB